VIDGKNVTVNVTEAVPTKSPNVMKFEDHCEYIDLQYIAKGKEEMDFGPVAESKIEKPYNAKNDAGIYSLPVAKIKKRIAQPGAFLIFFPSDAHHTDIKVEGCDTVKKIVFKIKAAGFMDPEERQVLEAKQFKSQK
jgi:YhcH/YjgK/YiaL family protein